jgi:hypothetical protein
MTAGISPALPDDFLDRIDQQLGDTDAFLARCYPGDSARRQPVHTVYVRADRYTVDLPRQWGTAARRLVDDHGGIEALCVDLGLSAEMAEQVALRVISKLQIEPIEDLRLDFEDGYGNRGDDVEDAEAVRGAGELASAIRSGEAPAFAGLRFKSLEESTRRRGIRTLDLFLGGLLSKLDQLPDGLVITLPKVSVVSQVERMVSVCEQLEKVYGLPVGCLRFEIQVETPQLVVGADGRLPVATAIHAGEGRINALHYGTNDYSASLQIAAEYQSVADPAADFAMSIMQVAAAGTGVHLADGSTSILPVGSAEDVRAAWRLHADLVRRGLERGYLQGWDTHPGHLPTRFLVNFAFYREAFPQAAGRLSDYVADTNSEILDEPASGRALARYLHRGIACGAIDEAELISSTGIDGDALAAMAFRRAQGPNNENTDQRSRG